MQIRNGSIKINAVLVLLRRADLFLAAEGWERMTDPIGKDRIEAAIKWNETMISGYKDKIAYHKDEIRKLRKAIR